MGHGAAEPFPGLCLVSEPEALFEEVSLRQVASYHAGDSLSEYLQSCERSYLLRALQGNNYRIGASATDLGISRKNLWEKMRRLGISSRDSSGSPPLE